MTPEQWQKIRPILESALELDAARRPEFLDEACADPSLRREVESLLSSNDKARSSFLESPPIEHLALSAGTKLGDYEVLSLVGSGGMGEVYRARDLRLARDVAIKVLPSSLCSDAERMRRFEQEARATAALNHPNILAVHQMGTYEGTPYLVSELLEGATLRDEMKSGPVRVRKAVDYGVQIARGLAAAHEKGIVHRDLKPENLFVTEDGRVKILDFGLAKLTQPQHGSEHNSTTLGAETEAGVVMGTVGYMAPEQVRGETADHRADIFAFGAILYEMLAGKRAFQKPTSPETMTAILNEDPPGISQVVPNLPPASQRVVHRCLEKNPEQRFQSASDLAFALEALSDPGASVASALPGGAKFGGYIAAAALFAALLTAGLYYRSHQSKPLTGKDTIVVADFTNATGDTVFDDTLRTALDVSLRQSPFINVLSNNRVTATLQLMTRPTGTKLTSDVARELCQRAGSKAYIEGSIASLGSEYVLGLKAVNCQSGDTLAHEQATATAKEKVLNALGEASSRLRSELGESLATVQKFDVPLAEATTSSLEALRAYSAGMTILRQRGDLAAIPFFQHAIELDPNFAMAYSALGACYGNISKPELGDSYVSKAFDLRDRTSERERFRLSAVYYSNITGQLERAAEIGELWAQTYPNDRQPHDFLGVDYRWLGQLDKALPHINLGLQKEPKDFNGLANLLLIYMAFNRLADAESAAEKMRVLAADVPHYSIYFLGFVRGDGSEMQHQLALAEAGKGDSELLASAAADTAAYHGRIEKHPAVPMTASNNEPAAISQLKRALWEAEFQLRDAARGDAREALANAPTRYVRILAALALARAGDTVAAQKLSIELGKGYPPDALEQMYWVSSIRAAVELNRNNPANAIKLLQAAANVELSADSLFPGATMHPVYLRGLAYLALHQGPESAAEFQKIIEHRGLVANCPLGALAHLQLARAYAMQGDAAKARAAYQDFFALWKDADSDVPILKEAKAEYAKLQ